MIINVVNSLRRTSEIYFAVPEIALLVSCSSTRSTHWHRQGLKGTTLEGGSWTDVNFLMNFFFIFCLFVINIFCCVYISLRWFIFFLIIISFIIIITVITISSGISAVDGNWWCLLFFLNYWSKSKQIRRKELLLPEGKTQWQWQRQLGLPYRRH